MEQRSISNNNINNKSKKDAEELCGCHGDSKDEDGGRLLGLEAASGQHGMTHHSMDSLRGFMVRGAGRLRELREGCGGSCGTYKA